MNAVCSFGTQVPEDVLTLARGLDAEVRWLVFGREPEQLEEKASLYGIAGVDRIDDPKLEGLAPDPVVEALTQYCREHAPRFLLFPQTFDVRLVAPRLAGRMGSAVVMNCMGLETEDGKPVVTAAAYGGDTRAVYALRGTGPYVLGVLPNAVEPAPAGSPTNPTVRQVAVDLSGVEERTRVVEPAHSDGPRLEEAEIIVSGGRGLGSPENYKLVEELAAALGGMAGASRPAVDDGWVDSSRQVGLTGKITRPGLYIAIGISGASQHMAGCSAARTVAAINRDPDAAIFRYARYGIVGDCTEILPELIRAVEE